METSVSADASRPTGPAATDASPPSFTLLVRIPFAPRSFITKMTKSVASAPIWRPKLPPSSANHGWSAPGLVEIRTGAARHDVPPVLCADYEARLQNRREDNYTVRPVEQFLGDVVWHIENFG